MKTISAKIENNKIVFLNDKERDLVLSQFEGKNVTLELKVKRKTRSGKQNSSLHLYFNLLSEALNDAGYDIRRTLKKDFDVVWTPDNIKNYIWRPVQLAYTKKESTKDSNTEEINKIYDIINKNLGEKTGVHIPFPSMESLITRQDGF